MKSNIQIQDDAQKLYDQFVNNFGDGVLQKNSLVIDKQEEIPKKLVWTRFSNSSDPLPPIRDK